MDSPFIHGRAALADASDLMARYGDDAGFEAALRAERSRDDGNVARFCHWRQIERVLAPLPDLGVDWPDLNAKDVTAPGPATASPATTGENGSQIRYTWTLEGLSGIGNAEDLLKAFRQQSALAAESKKPANAAQIGRRSRADADLLAELLRSPGYYDAAVRP